MNTGRDVLLWTRRGSPLRALLVISVGTISGLALTGLFVFALFFVAASANAIVIALLMFLAAAGGFLALFFAGLTAIYIGAVSVAVFVISTVTISAIIAALVATGDLKRVIARKTGLEPEDHKVLLRGEEKDNEERLQMVGVKDNSKIMVVEDAERKERRLEEAKRRNVVISKQCEAVAAVREEVNKLSGRVSILEVAVDGGIQVADKEFDMST